MDEGLHNTHIEPPVEHEDDDVASTKGTINDPEDGFRALLQFDVLNNQLTIQVLGGTLRLTFPFEEVTKVDKIGERKIFMEIDHGKNVHACEVHGNRAFELPFVNV